MNDFLESLDEYISLDKTESLGYATISSQVITSIDVTINEPLYNHILPYLPISFSILEEISSMNNNKNINNVFAKGTISEHKDNFDTKIEFIHDTKYTIDTTILSLYPIPYHSTSAIPTVGKHYLISKPNTTDVFLYCL